MIRISQLGRLGGALLDEELSLDLSSGSDESSSSKPSSEGSTFTPSSKVLDNLSLGGEEKAVVSNQTSDSTAGEVAAGVLSVAGDLFDKIGKHGGGTSFSPAQGQPVIAPPVSSGPSGATIALIAVGALAVLGVGYVATRPA